MNAIDRDDTAQKIAEIREALEKATPGPWNVEGKEIWKRAGWYFGDNLHVYICDADNPANAHLIANAPEWLRFLLDELERVNRERDQLIEGLRKLAKTNAENISEIREWKAKQNDPEVIDLDWYNYVARDTLKEIGVAVE